MPRTRIDITKKLQTLKKKLCGVKKRRLHLAIADALTIEPRFQSDTPRLDTVRLSAERSARHSGCSLRRARPQTSFCRPSSRGYIDAAERSVSRCNVVVFSCVWELAWLAETVSDVIS